MLSRFHLIPERNGQTDGQTDWQTDRFAISISRVSMLTRDKNHPILMKFGRLETWRVNWCRWNSDVQISLGRRPVCVGHLPWQSPLPSAVKVLGFQSAWKTNPYYSYDNYGSHFAPLSDTHRYSAWTTALSSNFYTIG